MSTDSIVRDLIKCHQKREKLEEQLKAANAEYDAINRQIAEEWAAGGIQRQTIELDGRRFTAYRRRSLRANVLASNRQRLVETCRELGLDDLIVTEVPTTKIKSWLAELVSPEDRGEDGEFDLDAIPEEIRPLVSLYEDVTVNVKKG